MRPLKVWVDTKVRWASMKKILCDFPDLLGSTMDMKSPSLVKIILFLNEWVNYNERLRPKEKTKIFSQDGRSSTIFDEVVINRMKIQGPCFNSQTSDRGEAMALQNFHDVLSLCPLSKALSSTG